MKLLSVYIVQLLTLFSDGYYLLLESPFANKKEMLEAKKKHPKDSMEDPRVPNQLKPYILTESLPHQAWVTTGPQCNDIETYPNVQQRYCSPKGEDNYCKTKRASIYTILNGEKEEDASFRIMHVYYSETTKRKRRKRKDSPTRVVSKKKTKKKKEQTSNNDVDKEEKIVTEIAKKIKSEESTELKAQGPSLGQFYGIFDDTLSEDEYLFDLSNASWEEEEEEEEKLEEKVIRNTERAVIPVEDQYIQSLRNSLENSAHELAKMLRESSGAKNACISAVSAWAKCRAKQISSGH